MTRSESSKERDTYSLLALLRVMHKGNCCNSEEGRARQSELCRAGHVRFLSPFLAGSRTGGVSGFTEGPGAGN
jgi:hypothetical protein